MRRSKSRGGYACAIAAIIAFVLVACGGGGDGGGGGSGGGGGGGGSPPAPDFTASTTSPNTVTSVQFTDLSIGSPTSWEWDFDNNGVVDSTSQNPSHLYTTAGTYSVKLIVGNGDGTNTLVKSSYITVTAFPPPTAQFSAAPTSGDTNTSVQFTDQSTGTPTSWQWDFENDSVVDSNSQNPVHQYTTPGTYSVTLTVSNAGGSDSLTRTAYITITAAGPVGPADIDVDTDRNGTVEAADESNEHIWNASGGAVFYMNQDDDDSNNVHDYSDSTSTGNDNNDLARIFVRQVVGAPSSGSITVTVSSAARGNIRVFRRNGSTWSSVYASGASFTLPPNDVAAGDIELGIEGRNRISSSWDGQVTLTLEVRDGSNTLLSSDAVILRMAPPIFATNLWEVEEYHVVSIPFGGSNNNALTSAMQTICSNGGFTYRAANGATYSNDRWLQDSSEPAVIQLPSSTGPRRVVDNVVQLARWREVDDWCEDELWGPEFDWFERFSTNTNSHNYGGNLEVVPPTTGRPYGTICYGGGTGDLIGTSTTVTENMTAVYRQFFDACNVQGPSFNYTSEWLAVGHIDEFTMFIPAPNTARGWVCLIASPDRAYQVLNTAPSNAVVFAGRSYQTTVSAILTDGALSTLNNEVQTRIDQARTTIKNNTGLTDADFIELPTLFEYVIGQWGNTYRCAAYNPGVVNLICLPSANGTTYLAIPDPEGPNNAGGQDMWQLDINAQLSALDTASNPYSITYVDVFESYHELLGEAHCGSNTVRTPPNMDWWDQ